MTEVGSINKLSEQLKKLIQPLRPGEFAMWQRTVSHKGNELTRDNTKKEFRVYPHNEIYAKDSIYDPWKDGVEIGEDGKEVGIGGQVDIGIPDKDGIDHAKKEIRTYRKFIFERSLHGGTVALDGKLPLHRELHEFFQISNINMEPVQGKKFRNPEIDVLLYLVNQKSESVKKNQLFKIKTDVLTHVGLMTVEQMREFAAGKNWDYNTDPETLAAMHMEYADKEPLKFNEDLQDPNMRKKALIKYALMENRIHFDPVQYQMKWPDGSVLATLERVKDKNEIDCFLAWVNTVSNGDKIMQQLNRKAKAIA
jgi:hypothetical protein